MLDQAQIEATVQRYRRREKERQGAKEKIEAGAILQADKAPRVQKRLVRLGVKPSTAREAIRSGATASDMADPIATGVAAAERRSVLNALERIIGEANFIGAGFLSEGALAARCVCRIQVPAPDGAGIFSGTGMLVSPRLVLTNNHVLETAAVARPAILEFEFEVGPDNEMPSPVRFELDPDACFLTDAELDYTLVAVRPNGSDGKAVRDYGWVPLIEQQGKAIIGECVNIIQHPNGEPKQVALRENRIVDVLDLFLHYETDTSPGSSGSPVFNDAWEIIALHHSGVPATDANGNILAIDGSIWTEQMGEHQVKWLANEGARVSQIVAHARAHADESGGPDLVTEATSGLEPTEQAIAPEPPRRRPPAPPRQVTDQQSPAAPVADEPATWTIPLQVSIRVGAPTLGSTAAPATSAGRQARGEGGDLAGDTELAEALHELERGRARPYYEPAADETARDEYYRGLPGRRAGETFFDALHELLTRTHTEQPRYKPKDHVYPWVDLQPNGMLRSIYTDEEFDPADFIEADIRIERARANRLRELLVTEAGRAGFAPHEALALLEADMPFNCEHVVPQSWFDAREPMRGDLHHLFACQSACNSFRGNRPFIDFLEFDEAVRDDCGMWLAGQGFEPRAGKGPAARATLYFLLRYPGEINRVGAEYEAERLDLLVGWHQAEEVSEYELHRNAAIFAKQGNRNPLIDFPAWAEEIAFERGLGPATGGVGNRRGGER